MHNSTTIMCPFASLLQRSGIDLSDGIGCPALQSSASKSQQQPMKASEQSAPLHVGTRSGSMCPWQQATSNSCTQPVMPHNTSSDSLVDDLTAFSIPALTSSSTSSWPEHTDLRVDSNTSSSTAGL